MTLAKCVLYSHVIIDEVHRVGPSSPSRAFSNFRIVFFAAHKHCNFTGFVLWYYQRDRGFSSWVPKLPRKYESRHWFPCGADLRSFVRSVYDQADYKMLLEWVDLLTHGAPQARPRAPL